MNKIRNLSLLFVLFYLSLVAVPAQMKIHHINVGQGEAMLLEFPGAAVLIDAGGPAVAGDRYRAHLKDYLDRFFARRTNLRRSIYSFIITHPHIDHTSFVMDVFNNYRVQNFVDNGDESDKLGQRPVNEARAFIDAANAASPLSIIRNKIDESDIGPGGYQTRWHRDLEQRIPGLEIRFLNASRDCADENNDSLVVLVKYGNTKLLVTGDAEWESDSRCTAAIPRMLARFGSTDLMDVDVYKVGHHGSRNATNTAYLQELTPQISLISAGHHSDRNADGSHFTAFHYGHPRKQAVDEIIRWTTRTRPQKQAYTLDRVQGNPLNMNLTKAVYCTCWDGDIVISTNSAGTITRIETTN